MTIDKSIIMQSFDEGIESDALKLSANLEQMLLDNMCSSSHPCAPMPPTTNRVVVGNFYNARLVHPHHLDLNRSPVRSRALRGPAWSRGANLE